MQIKRTLRFAQKELEVFGLLKEEGEEQEEDEGSLIDVISHER